MFYMEFRIEMNPTMKGIPSFFFILAWAWRRAIFPQGLPCSIVTAVEFHH